MQPLQFIIHMIRYEAGTGSTVQNMSVMSEDGVAY